MTDRIALSRRGLLATGLAMAASAGVAANAADEFGDDGEALADLGLAMVPEVQGTRASSAPQGGPPVAERDAGFLASSGRLRPQFRRSGQIRPDARNRSLSLFGPPASGRGARHRTFHAVDAAEALSDRHLTLSHVRTGERLSLSYCLNGVYDSASLSRLDRFFRDWRENAVIPIDTRVLDVLALIQRAVGRDQPLTILSGYRTQQTNAMLARTNSGVARNSFHMRGMAVDLTLDRYDIAALSGFARSLRAGGVGFYPRQGFVHVDCGPVRSWSA